MAHAQQRTGAIGQNLGAEKKSTNVHTFNIFCTVQFEPIEIILNPKLNTLKSSKLLNN